LIEIPFNFAKKIDKKNEGRDFNDKKSFITLFCGVTK